MKTITEFDAIQLKNAALRKKEVADSGKTAEEQPAALAEALKLEGDKLNFLLQALDAVGTKTQDLKRVIVMTVAEGEKTPPGARQQGEHWYLVEYFRSLNPPRDTRREGRFGGKGRDGKRDGKRGDKRGGGGGRRDERPGERPAERGARGPRRIDGISVTIVGAPPAGLGGAGAPSEGRAEGRAEGRRGSRPPRKREPSATSETPFPRPPKALRPPRTPRPVAELGPIVITPVGGTPTVVPLVKAPPAPAPVAIQAPSLPEAPKSPDGESTS